MASSAPARPRLFFVDYVRGWAIIGMVAAHYWHVFLREDVLDRVHGESVFFVLTFAAGLFFGVVGVSCALFLGEERAAERRRELARRGWLVFLAGFLWTLMLRDLAQFDFLHCIGIAMAACGLLAVSARGWMAGLALIPICWGIVAWQQTALPAGLEPASGVSGFLMNSVLFTGHFPLPGWLPVVFLGYALGVVLVRQGNKPTRFLRALTFAAGAVFTAAAYLAAYQGWGLSKIPISLGYSILTCGVFALFWVLCSLLEGVSKWVPLRSVTVTLGTFALPATAIHWLIGRSIMPRLHLTGDMGLPAFLITTAAILALIALAYRPWMALVNAWNDTRHGWLRSPWFLATVGVLSYLGGYVALALARFRFHETVSSVIACAGILVLCLPLYSRRARKR